MLTEATIDKMNAMKLYAMAQGFQDQLKNSKAAELSFEERVGFLVDTEWTERQQRKLRLRLLAAKLRHQASLEDINWDAHRGLDRSMILSLASCGFIRDHHNVTITGPTGVGKSFIACALAERACRSGYSAYYTRASRLYQDLIVARADGSYGRLLARLTKTDLLVIDDWGLSPLTDSERRDLLEVVEDRYDRSSTIITSQLPTKAWHEIIAEATLADAICDRLLNRAHKIELKGASLRQAKANTSSSGKPTA